MASRSISLEGHAAVLDLARGDDLEVADLLGGLGAAVGLDQADRDVDPLLLEPVPFAEHGVGLAHARRRAQVDLEPAPLLAADQVEELLGVRAARLDVAMTAVFRGGCSMRRPWRRKTVPRGGPATPRASSAGGVGAAIGPGGARQRLGSSSRARRIAIVQGSGPRRPRRRAAFQLSTRPGTPSRPWRRPRPAERRGRRASSTAPASSRRPRAAASSSIVLPSRSTSPAASRSGSAAPRRRPRGPARASRGGRLRRRRGVGCRRGGVDRRRLGRGGVRGEASPRRGRG